MVRFGVVGIGNIGSAHTGALFEKKIAGAVLTALCDICPEKRQKAKQYGVPVFENIDALLASGQTDALMIAVPHPAHAVLAIKALAAGQHICLEKPMDIRVSRGEELCAAAEKSNRIFSMMFNQRTDMLFQKARALVQNGTLGALQRTSWIITNWFRSQYYYDSGQWRATWLGEGGGVLVNQAPHQLDLWQWLCGKVKSVRAICSEGKYHDIEVEDAATLLVTFENGATGTFITSTGEGVGTNRLELVGDKGKIVLEEGKLRLWTLSESSEQVCKTSTKNSPQIPCEYTEFTAEATNGHLKILQNFTDAIEKGTPLIAPGTEGLAELSLACAAYLSAWTGEEIFLPIDAAEYDRLLSEKQKASVFKQKQKSTSQTGEYRDRWSVQW